MVPFGKISAATDILIIHFFFFLHKIFQHLFEFLFADAQGGCIDIAVNPGQVKKIGDIFFFIPVGKIVPESMTGQIGFFKSQIVKIGIPPGKDGRF